MLCTVKCTFSYAPESLLVAWNGYEPDHQYYDGKKNKPNSSDFIKMQSFQQTVYVESDTPKQISES